MEAEGHAAMSKRRQVILYLLQHHLCFVQLYNLIVVEMSLQNLVEESDKGFPSFSLYAIADRLLI